MCLLIIRSVSRVKYQVWVTPFINITLILLMVYVYEYGTFFLFSSCRLLILSSFCYFNNFNNLYMSNQVHRHLTNKISVCQLILEVFRIHYRCIKNIKPFVRIFSARISSNGNTVTKLSDLFDLIRYQTYTERF